MNGLAACRPTLALALLRCKLLSGQLNDILTNQLDTTRYLLQLPSLLETVTMFHPFVIFPFLMIRTSIKFNTSTHP